MTPKIATATHPAALITNVGNFICVAPPVKVAMAGLTSVALVGDTGLGAEVSPAGATPVDAAIGTTGTTVSVVATTVTLDDSQSNQG